MATFILIHGACHGAWCWDQTLPFFNNGPHRALAIDLPGRGAGAAPPEAVTMDGFGRAILAAAEGSEGPVVLVGHSMGGYAITAAALMAPGRFARLIHLCAYMPEPGLSLNDITRAWPERPLRPAIRLAPDRRSFGFDPAVARDLFYHDCPAEAAECALARLCPEPTGPHSAAFDADPATPRHYVVCTADRAIPPGHQQAMAGRLSAECRSSLPSGHAPFLAMPGPLAAHLAALAP